MQRSIAVLVPLLIAMTPSLLSAQRHYDRIRRVFDRDSRVEIGLVGGPNRNTVTGAGPVDAEFRGSLGGYLSVPVAGSLRIRPEIGISGKQVGFTGSGTQCGIDPVCPGGSSVASFTWLEAPILLEMRFPRSIGRSATPRLYGGPFVAVRLACSISTPSGTGQPEVLQDPRLVSNCNPSGDGIRYNNGDAGFMLGGAVAVSGVGLGLRWTRSLVPIAEQNQGVVGNQLLGAKHSTLSLMLELGTRLY